jgi:hypothetical protein
MNRHPKGAGEMGSVVYLVDLMRRHKARNATYAQIKGQWIIQLYLARGRIFTVKLDRDTKFITTT